MHVESGINPEDYPDEEPLSEEEEAWARGYAETLAVGAPEPGSAGLDPVRLATIRRALDAAWRAKVRRIYRRRKG